MADAGLVLRQTMTDIASAIRTKCGASGNLRPSQMAQAILSISGGGGGGGVTAPEFLTHSDASKVLVNAYYADYDAATPAWGGLAIAGTPVLYAGGVRVASAHGFSYPVSAQNHSITVYAIVASLDARDVSAMAMAVIAEETTGKGPNISSTEGKWRISNWSGTTIEESVSSRFSVLAMSIDIDNSAVNFYINGASVGSKNLTGSGATVRFNGSMSHSSWAGSFAFLFAGIVDGCEDSATILANQADMMQLLQDGRIGIPGGGNVARYSVSVAGGFNGGAVITVQIKGTTIFTATATDTYNLVYDKVSGSQTVEGVEYTVTVTPPANSTSLLGISLSNSEEERTFSVQYDGRNTSYGYNYSDDGTILIPSGGGDGIPVYTQAQWNALTYAQKTAVPFVAIKTSDSVSALDVGELYQTSAVVNTDLLPNSDPSKIMTIAEGTLKSDGSWGNGTQRINTYSQCSQAEDSVLVANSYDSSYPGVCVAYSSTTTGKPFTAYIVAKVSEDTDGILGSNNENNAEWAGVVMRYENGRVTIAKDYDEQSTPITPEITENSGYFVACIRGSGTTESGAAILVGTNDAPTFHSYTVQKTGRYMGIGCSQSYTGHETKYKGKLNVKFFGLVSEAESDAVVTENMKALSQAFASQSS